MSTKVKSTNHDMSLNTDNNQEIQASEMLPASPTSGFRYLEGRPKQYRADAKAGNFNVNGGKPIGDTLSFTPLAWRFFEDDILQLGNKKWVELFFVDDKNCVSAILFHGYSREHLEKLAQDLFYDDITLSDIVLTVKFVQKKNEKIKPAATYHIAEFEVEEIVDMEKVKQLQSFANTHKIYRLETLSETCRLQACHNYHIPPDLLPLSDQVA
jgi:hypothetical protein